jgi:hypothetical protein
MDIIDNGCKIVGLEASGSALGSVADFYEKIKNVWLHYSSIHVCPRRPKSSNPPPWKPLISEYKILVV